MTDADLSKLHPITNFLGITGPLLFGSFGVIYLTLLLTFDISFNSFLYISLAGLGMFILGAITIPLQKDRLEEQEDD